jgi:hypothetical protein
MRVTCILKLALLYVAEADDVVGIIDLFVKFNTEVSRV